MGKWKYKLSDICKTYGCKRTVRVKGYCEKCYLNNKQREKKKINCTNK